MSIRFLNLRDLAYVCALAEHRHFGRAAEACAITQPALSERIRRIEEALNTMIFERTKRSVLLTPTGQEIVDTARKVLDQADDIDTIANAEQQPLASEFRLGVIATLGPYLMPRLLGKLRRQYPNLQLRLTEGLTDRLLDELAAGVLDAVLAALPLPRADFNTKPLFFEPFWLAAPRDHRLATQKSVTARDIRGDEMILLEEGHCLSGHALDVCPTNRRGSAARLQATGLETLRHMVASGTRYTLLPWLAVGEQPMLEDLIAYKPFAGKSQGRTIGIIWRKTFPRRRDIKHFAGFISEHLPRGLEPT